VSLSDDLRKIKIVARMRIESIVQSIGKSLVDDIKKDYEFDFKLTDAKVNGDEVLTTIAGQKDYDDIEKSDKTKDEITKYVNSLSDESLISMVKKYGDL